MYLVYWNQAAAAYWSPYFFIFFLLNFQTLKFFITLFSGTVRPRRLKLGTHVDNGQMYHVYQNQASAAYSSLYFFIFLSLQFSALKFFVTLVSWTTRPRRLKIGTLVDSGQMYHVYQIQAAAAYSSLYFFIFLSLQFSNIKIFVTLFSGMWGLEDWNLVQMWIVGWCVVYTGIRLLLLIHPIISSFFFLSNYQTLKNFVTFSQELWGLEDWNLVHMWIEGRCIVYTGIRLLLICPFISSLFFLSNFQTFKYLVTLLTNCEA